MQKMPAARHKVVFYVISVVLSSSVRSFFELIFSKKNEIFDQNVQKMFNFIIKNTKKYVINLYKNILHMFLYKFKLCVLKFLYFFPFFAKKYFILLKKTQKIAQFLL